MFIADVACNLQNTSQGEIWRAIMMRKGPNNARHIVWALGECFLISFVFFDDNICFNADMTYNIQTTRLERLWKAKMVRKGPNDVSSIVWTLGECFSFVFYDDNCRCSL